MNDFEKLNANITKFEESLYNQGYRVTAQVPILDTNWVLIYGKHNRRWRLIVAEVDGDLLYNENPLVCWSLEARIKASKCLDALQRQLDIETDVISMEIKKAAERYAR